MQSSGVHAIAERLHAYVQQLVRRSLKLPSSQPKSRPFLAETSTPLDTLEGEAVDKSAMDNTRQWPLS